MISSIRSSYSDDAPPYVCRQRPTFWEFHSAQYQCRNTRKSLLHDQCNSEQHSNSALFHKWATKNSQKPFHLSNMYVCSHIFSFLIWNPWELQWDMKWAKALGGKNKLWSNEGIYDAAWDAIICVCVDRRLQELGKDTFIISPSFPSQAFVGILQVAESSLEA